METGDGRAQSAGSEELWVRLEQASSWDDLVLGRYERELLRTISAKARTRDQVVRAGGFRHGLTVLFVGESGTGKTMSARILGAELDRPVFQVDLPKALSESGGEFEPVAEHVFAAAERENAIVVFDRVRSSVDQHPDAMAGTTLDDGTPVADISYLLSRGGPHPGLVIFTWRPAGSLALAVPERADFVVEFPFPGAAARSEIWRRQLPSRAQVSDADLRHLARSFRLTGGAIRRCAMTAAAEAREQGVPVGIGHLAGALELEYRGTDPPQHTRMALSLLRASARRPAGRSASRRPARPGAGAGRQPPVASFRPPPGGLARSTPAVTPPGRGGWSGSHRWEKLELWLRERWPAGGTGERWMRDRTLRERWTRYLAGRERWMRDRAGRERWMGDRAGRERWMPGRSLSEFRVPDHLQLRALAARRWTWVVVGAIVAAAVLGFSVARATGGSSTNGGRHELAASGQLRVSTPASWRGIAVPLGVAPFVKHRLAVGPGGSGHGVLVIGRARTSDASLLPSRLLTALGDVPAPQLVKLGALSFYRYAGLRPSGAPAAESVYALPSTSGTILAVCAPQSAGAGFAGQCESVLATIRLTAGRPLVPGPDVAYAASLEHVLARLSSVRSTAGSRLAAARSATALAQAANALAAAHWRAAAALARLSAGAASAANSALSQGLRMTADGYTALAGAATRNDSVAYSAARAALGRADSAVNAAFVRLRDLGYSIA